MPELTPQLRRGLVAASAVLFFVGVIGVAVNDPDEQSVDLAGQNTSTTLPGGGGDAGDLPGVSDTGPVTTGGAALTTVPGLPSRPATTTKPRATGTTAVPPATTPAQADPGPTRPPALGTYKYSVSETDQDGTTNSERATKVEAGQDSPGVTRRVSSTETPMGPVKATDAWSASGVRQEKLVASTPQGDLDCDWEPDILIYAQPLSVGQKWSGDSSCENTVQGQRVKVRVTGERRVVGRAITTVGGTEVVVWVIETTLTSVISSGSTTYQTDKGEEVAHFEPTRGLVVYAKDTVEGSGFARNGRTVEERRLLSLNPS